MQRYLAIFLVLALLLSPAIAFADDPSDDEEEPEVPPPVEEVVPPPPPLPTFSWDSQKVAFSYPTGWILIGEESYRQGGRVIFSGVFPDDFIASEVALDVAIRPGPPSLDGILQDLEQMNEGRLNGSWRQVGGRTAITPIGSAAPIPAQLYWVEYDHDGLRTGRFGLVAMEKGRIFELYVTGYKDTLLANEELTRRVLFSLRVQAAD